MENRFYTLKAALVGVALVVAGMTAGSQFDQFSERVVATRYSAAVYATEAAHQTSHEIARAVGRLLSRFR